MHGGMLPNSQVYKGLQCAGKFGVNAIHCIKE